MNNWINEKIIIENLKSFIIDKNLPINMSPLGLGISLELINPTENSFNFKVSPSQ